jgi:Ca-activated chloride channel family protein
MVFRNPDVLWLLLALPPLLAGLGVWGWRIKRKIAGVFQLDVEQLRTKQVEKYVMAGLLSLLLTLSLSLPEVAFSSSPIIESTGEVMLQVDTSASMAAQKNHGSPSRLARVKTMLYEIIGSMEELGQVRVSLFGFTNTARSLVPFVAQDDYPYLTESIDRVLDINSVPGQNSSLGQPILDVLGKFSDDAQSKLIVLFSDGEPFMGQTRGMSSYESGLIEKSIRGAAEKGVKVLTVGVGEAEGAKIPIFNTGGEFTGAYAKLQGIDFVSYLEDSGLRNVALGTAGEYFFENDQVDVSVFIMNNLASVGTSELFKEVKNYQSVAIWFILAVLPIWAIFVRRHVLV